MFTFIGLLSCCLFTEMSADPHTRLKLNRYFTVGSLIGSQSILVLEFASNSLQNVHAFQLAAGGIAVCSCLLMLYTGNHAHTQHDVEEKKSQECAALSEKETESNKEPFFRKLVQIFKERNFIAFVIVNFLQQFYSTFWSGFLAILCEWLVSTDEVSHEVRSVFYGLVGVAGDIVLILMTPVFGRVGYFHVIRSNFVWKIVSGLTMYFLIGPGSSWIIMLYILVDRAFGGASFSLYMMPLSEIVDADKVKYNRRQPISSSVFGCSALVGKPAQSLSPMLVVTILNRYGYEHLKDQKETAPVEEKAAMRAVMFQLLCFFPVVLGIMQYIAWSQFAIRNRIVETVVTEDSKNPDRVAEESESEYVFITKCT